MSQPESAARRPAEMDQLTDIQRLVVRAYRHWVIGLNGNASEHWALVWNELARELGPTEGGAALSAFAALILGLLRDAPHTLYHHQPRCPCLCADECRLLGLIDACQRGAWVEARGIASWLVKDDAVGDLLDAGSRFALAMSRRGLRLSGIGLAEADLAWLEVPSQARH